MKALLLESPGTFIWEERPMAKAPGYGEVMVKVRRIGICGTDLHAYEGSQPFFNYPRVLGHELGVEVVELGEGVEHIQVGDTCSVEPYRNTTLDQAVRRGKTNCGENLSVIGVHEDGGMQEYFTYPAKYLYKSERLSLEQLALVETLGIGCHAVNRASVGTQDTVLVIGVGPIGLGTVQFAQAAGAQKVLAMDINPSRLDFASNVMGVDGTVMAGDHAEEQIREKLNGDLPTVVFDATGHAQSMMKAFDYVAYGGILVYIGLFVGEISFYDPYFHKKEITLMSSRNALGSEFVQIIDYLEQGKITTDPWITHRTTFDQVPDQFDSWLDPKHGVIKAVVEM